jgi:ABC-type polysaccharide/polyol phosphate transport system ATPase subunit
MSCDTAVIKVQNLSKSFRIYDRQRHRVNQFLLPLKRLLTGSKQPDYYREFQALRHVSFEVGKGQTVGILGQNGSGKSTLLQIIAGTMEPTTGEVMAEGKIGALLELGSGFNPDFTGRENVYLNGTLLGMTRSQIDEKFDYIVAFAEIGEHLDMPVKTYSSGMMLRLAFAVQVAVEMPVLIIDEALSVGDARFQRKCFRRLAELKASGTTILFVSHATDLIRSFCDLGLVLDKGNVIYWGDARTATVKYLATLFPDQTQKSGAEEGETGEGMYYKDGCVHVHPGHSSVHSFGVGGVCLNWLKIEGLDAPNIAIGGRNVTLRYEFTWDQAVIRELIETEGYRNDLCPSISLSDAQGNHIFGCNSFDYELPVDALATNRHIVEFRFAFPYLQPGEYFLTVAIALGGHDHHVQLRWYDALVPIRFLSEKRKVYGVMRLDYQMQLVE